MSAAFEAVGCFARRVACPFLASLIMGLTVAAAQADVPARSVLILDQSFPGPSAYAQIEEAFREHLGPGRAAIYAEKLDLNHFGGPEHRRVLQAYLKQKYRETPIDVIVAFGERALLCAISFRNEDRSAIPIVFGAVASQAIERLAPSEKVTGRTVDISLANFVNVARMLVPGLKRVVLVGDPLEKQTFRRHFKQEASQVASEMELVDLTGLPMRLLKERVGALPDDSAILYTTINIDGDGQYFLPRDALKILLSAANRPIVVDVGTHMGFGAAGGFALMSAPVGRETAQIVSRILEGEDAAQIPIVPSNAMKLAFDWNVLQRWNISEARLPPESDILFRPVTGWKRYQWQIGLVLLAFVMQTALIAALLFEDRARRAAQSQSFQLLTELARRDRIAIAGELSASIAHEVRQPLSAIVAYGTAGMRWLSHNTPNLAEAKKALQVVVDQAHRAGDVIKSVRAMFSHEGEATKQIDIGVLIRKVLELTNTEMRRRGVKLMLELDDEPRLDVEGNDVQLQQVILNIVLNAIDAMSLITDRDRVLRVTASAKNGEVLVSVEDTGTGIDPNNLDKIFNPFFTTKHQGMGLGLSICRSIVEAHGGKLTARNGADRGAVVQIAIPRVRVSHDEIQDIERADRISHR
jgi:signal transduction histidine kinase